jgi:hypothetical protein
VTDEHAVDERPRMSRRACIAIVAIALGAGASPPAAAWGPPRWVSAEAWSATDTPTVAVDRQGDALLAWEACDGRLPACDHRIQLRTRGRGGAFGPVIDVSDPGAAPAWPEVAIDDDGDGIVAWQQHDPASNWRIAARRFGRDGTPSRLLVLSPAGPIANSPQVAITPRGRALVAWTEDRGGTWHTVARRVSARGAVGPALELGTASAEPPAVAIDRRGAAVIAWSDTARVIARRVTARAVSAPRVIAGPTSATALVRVGVDRDGDALVGFVSGAGADRRVRIRRWSRGGALSRLRAVSPPAHAIAFHLALATDLQGDGVVVWTRALPDDRFAVHGRLVPRRGHLGRVARFGRGDRPDVTLDDAGGGAVVWQYPDDDIKTAVRSRRIRPRGFGPVRTVARDAAAPRAGAAPRGRVVAVWQRPTYLYRIGVSVD